MSVITGRRGVRLDGLNWGKIILSFFHAMATTRFRRNFIATLRGEDGRMVSDHDEWLVFYGLPIKTEWGSLND